LSASINNDLPTQYYGPAGEIGSSVGGLLITDLPWHFQLATTSYFRTNGPVKRAAFAERNRCRRIYLGSERRRDSRRPNCRHEPRLVRPEFWGWRLLNKLIAKVRRDVRWTIDTAGQALVDAGLSRLFNSLPWCRGSNSQTSVNGPKRKSSLLYDGSSAELELEVQGTAHVTPMVDGFNIFNKTNTEGPLSGVLSGGLGNNHGTTAYFTRVGAGSGSFLERAATGFPEFGHRVLSNADRKSHTSGRLISGASPFFVLWRDGRVT